MDRLICNRIHLPNGFVVAPQRLRDRTYQAQGCAERNLACGRRSQISRGRLPIWKLRRRIVACDFAGDGPDDPGRIAVFLGLCNFFRFLLRPVGNVNPTTHGGKNEQKKQS